MYKVLQSYMQTDRHAYTVYVTHYHELFCNVHISVVISSGVCMGDCLNLKL